MPLADKESKLTKRLLYAFSKGYRVSNSGEALNPQGKPLVSGKIGKYRKISVGGPYPGSVRIHRLAAYQWFGEKIFEPGLCVRHLDNNPNNNTKSNLAIGTQADNAHDSSESLMERAVLGATWLRKWSDEIVLKIREDRKNGLTYRKLVKKYNISLSTIYHMINQATTY